MRIAGLISFMILLGLFVAGREIPLAFILIVAGMLGLESVQGFLQRNGRS